MGLPIKKIEVKDKSEWLDRSLIVGNYFCLCLTDKDYNKKLDDIKIPKIKREPFVPPYKAGAQTHFYSNKENETCCIITLLSHKKHSLCAVMALLAHEAMHIWRDVKDAMKERTPSSEFEAYAIQSICLELFTSFCEQTGRKNLTCDNKKDTK